MCLVRSRPAWEEDVVFSNRPARRRHSRTRVSETIITERTSQQQQRPVQYIQAPPPPRASTPIIRPVTPPKTIRAPSPPRAPPSPARVELVSVEEDSRSSPRTSRVSVSTGKGRHRRGSRGEEVYIERERERVRMAPEPRQPDYHTFQYVEGPKREQRYLDEGDMGRRRSRSITYETNPRHSGRLVERERVVIQDGERRQEFYRRT